MRADRPTAASLLNRRGAVLRPESIRRECEASLRRLGVERIDLYQFHWPDERARPSRIPGAKCSGWSRKARCGRRASRTSTWLCWSAANACGHVDSLQPPFSLIRRDTARGTDSLVRRHGTGVIVYSPMQSGLLTDRFDAERVARFAEDDWRRSNPEFQEPNLSRNLRLRDALRPIAQRHGTTVAAIAVAWTLIWPGVTGAIVGARSAEQVDGWIRAGEIELTPQDVDEIARAIGETQAGSGPARPKALRASAD